VRGAAEGVEGGDGGCSSVVLPEEQPAVSRALLGPTLHGRNACTQASMQTVTEVTHEDLELLLTLAATLPAATAAAARLRGQAGPGSST
jgi:hypothetical protein